MSKKTIVQILRSPEGGIRKHVVDILERLPNNNYQKVFITSIKDSDRDLSYLVSKYNVEMIDLAIKDRPEINDFFNVLKIINILKSRPNLVLHGHGAKGGVYARVCSFILRCPSLYTPHGGSLHRVFGKIKSLIYDFIERVLILLTDKFVFESHYSANEFNKHVGKCENKSVINYNGISFPEFYKDQQYIAHKQIKLASFGLLRHLKGHDIVIDACHLLNQKKIDFTYTIYGYGEMEESLLFKIKTYQLEDRIKIENYSDNILKKMCEFDLIIHPSRFESFGYVPVEAMSVKVPVLTSFEGGLREVVVENGSFIAFNNTASEYANIIAEVYEGKIDLNKRVEYAYLQIKQKFSVEVMVSNLDKIYQSFFKEEKKHA